MSETVYQVIEGRPLRIVQIVLYVGGAPVVTELTSSPDERARVMTYLRGEPGTGGGGAGAGGVDRLRLQRCQRRRVRDRLGRHARQRNHHAQRG